MCRIESQALMDIEGFGAAERIKNAEDRLTGAMVRMSHHVINRLRQKHGLPPLDTPLSLTSLQREQVRANIKRLAEAAC